MKIIIVGANGTIGKKVTPVFKKKHDVITAGRKSGDETVDISSLKSIKSFFEQIGNFDALISVSGEAFVGPLDKMTGADFRKSIDSKLMGQINLVLIGKNYINPNGSFVFTSASWTSDPVANGINLSTVNGGIDSFVIAAAVELKNGVRINAVSPDVVEDSPELFSMFPGHIPSKMDVIVAAYEKAVLGVGTGQILSV